MTKSSQAFRTIREVAEWLGVAAHVLRFWESKFPQIKPVKRAGGRRYYRPADMELVGGIKVLLHDRGLTIRGVQRMIREGGIAAVTALSPPLDLAPALAGDLAADWAADAEQILPPPQPRAEEAPADEASTPAPGPCMQTALARLAAHVAGQASLGPDRRMRLAKALSALHAQMRAQAPA
jgi:DNA-binding transcriptional MerR regulator